MDIIEDVRTQRAVYWAPASLNEEGVKTFDEAVELVVRWDASNQTFMDRSGNTQVSRAQVQVGEDVKELGVLWLSERTEDDSEGSAIADLTDETDPFANDGAYEIRRFDKIPTIDGDEFLRIAYL